jgi:polyhydroxyalkanoate synthesis regulator phasin
LYTGVGVVSTTTDRVKKSIEELSQVSEEAQEEGKKKVDVATDELNTRREEMSARFKKVVDTVLSQFDFPNRTESETLNAKIAELEERLATKKKTVRKAAKKTATKAKTTAKAVVAEVKEMVKK